MSNNKISEMQKELRSLQKELSNSDYIYFKKIEYEMLGKALENVDFLDLHQRREELRRQIRDLKQILDKG